MRKLFLAGILLGVGFLMCVVLYVWQVPIAVISPLSSSTIISLFPTPIIPSLTAETIFSSDNTWVKDLPSNKTITLIATGDIILARSVNSQTVKARDFTWAWKHIASLLKSGDITLINLESPLVPNCPITVDGMVFCGDQRHVEGLLFAGVDVANFANNHMGNYGADGIEETKQLMEKNSIKVSGLAEPAILEVKGIRIAFLGFDDIGPNVFPIANTDEEMMKKKIADAKKIADIVIVSMNWGVEYTDKPTDRQRELAHLAIDSGVDLIIGNHPHWIQSLELYNGKVIMYAHGNTIFDQMWSEKTKEGVIGKYTLYDKKLVDIEFIPTYIKDYGQPMFLEGEKKNAIRDQLKAISVKQ